MRHKILIIDDDPDIADALATALYDEGYETRHAANGAEALSVLSALDADELPCLMLLDVMMPVMDAYGFRERQVVDHRISRIPVIVVTAGMVRDPDKLDGVAAIIKKPLALERLLLEVARHCPG
jgi:CheY-like chemotaxis protein